MTERRETLKCCGTCAHGMRVLRENRSLCRKCMCRESPFCGEVGRYDDLCKLWRGTDEECDDTEKDER